MAPGGDSRLSWEGFPAYHLIARHVKRRCFIMHRLFYNLILRIIKRFVIIQLFAK